jgi:cell wall-associated NlpC family hydrolase
MRRGLLVALLLALALCMAVPAQAASWARPQIRTVVDHGLMGPSVSAFRPSQPLTRGELGQALTNLTGQPWPVSEPGRHVLMRELDRNLVRALGLAPSAAAFQAQARTAGLKPPSRFGTEVVARLLGLRHNHPAANDARELRPQDEATRAEAAYSLAAVLGLNSWDTQSVSNLAASFGLPAFSEWQRRVLARAVSLVGYPYVWGGTSTGRQTLFGVTSRGGFDCSGFVWRVYKLRPFPGAPQLQNVLRGRTTYQMSGEFPKRQRIGSGGLKPGDLVFFGDRGTSSKPAQVMHMGIYMGNGWFIHSSGQGTTLMTLSGWYADRFAWGRRPLREAGLS